MTTPNAWQWFVVLLVAIAAGVLGVIGYAAYLPTQPEYAAATAADVVYYTLQLFAFGSTPLDQPQQYPAALQIARFLAPASTIIALVETLRVLLSERLRRWAAANAKGHTVVIGNDSVALLLSRRFAADGARVVVVSESVSDLEARRRDLLVVPGDPTHEATLRAAGVHRAATVYICGQQSATNVAVALTVRGFATNTVTIEAEVRDSEMFAPLRRRGSGGNDPGHRIWLNFFVVEELAARTLLAQESLIDGYDQAGPVAVLGDGAFGQALLRQLEQRRKRTGAATPVLVQDADVPSWRPSATDGLRAYICVTDPDVGLRTAMYLTDTGIGRAVLCLPHAGPFETAATGVVDAIPSLTVFGILDAACEAAPRDHLDELGRAIHERYVERGHERGETEQASGSLVPWSSLPAYLRASNRAQANHIGTKLATIGCAIVPAVAGAEPFEFRDGEIEQLARMEHQRWSNERRAAGFEYGTVRHARFHPDLVPWEDLTEESRRKDIDTIEALPDLLANAGYQIMRL